MQHMDEHFSRKPSRINLLVNDMKGTQSGGSLITMFEQYMLPDDEMQLCEDPFCLDAVPTKDSKGGNSAGSEAAKQEGGKEGRAGSPPHPRPAMDEETDQFGVRYNKQLNKWTYPFQFSSINSRVVRRTCALLYRKPRLFKYESSSGCSCSTASLRRSGHA